MRRKIKAVKRKGESVIFKSNDGEEILTVDKDTPDKTVSEIAFALNVAFDIGYQEGESDKADEIKKALFIED